MPELLNRSKYSRYLSAPPGVNLTRLSITTGALGSAATKCSSSDVSRADTSSPFGNLLAEQHASYRQAPTSFGGRQDDQAMEEVRAVRRTQAERRDEARQRVLEAATSLVAAHGSRAMSLAAVGEAAG